MSEQSIFSERLIIRQLNPSDLQEQTLIESITKILTPAVTHSLPNAFHSATDAESVVSLLTGLMSEAMVFQFSLRSLPNCPIGLVFLAPEQTKSANSAHLGYLLAEQYWRQGLAFELLQALLTQLRDQGTFERIIAGVEADNIGSIKLLEKLGFELTSTQQENHRFYQLLLADFG